MLSCDYHRFKTSRQPGETSMQGQRKRAEAPKAALYRAPRPEYTAAVRYLDGKRDIFRIRNADDIADARAMVISELGDVQSIMIALRHH